MVKFKSEVGLKPEEKDMIIKIVERTKEIYDGDMIPTFFLSNSKKSEMNIVSGMFSNQMEKVAFATTVKKMVREMKADGVMAVIESWSIPTEHAEDFMNNRDKYPTVSDYPKAFDCVMFSYENLKGTWMVSVKCNPKKKTMDTGDIEFVKADGMQGLMSNFIPLKEILN